MMHNFEEESAQMDKVIKEKKETLLQKEAELQQDKDSIIHDIDYFLDTYGDRLKEIIDDKMLNKFILNTQLLKSFLNSKQVIS